MRRLPTPFVLEWLRDVTTVPWDHGYASLGHRHRTLYSKHVSPPQAFGMPMIDVDAEHVKNYAATHAGSNSDQDDLPEAGIDAAAALAGEPQVPESGATAPMDSNAADSHKRHESEAPVLPGSPKKQRIGEEQPMTPADDLMEDLGESAPKTPKLSESPRQQQMMQVTSTDLNLYEHEDAAVKVDSAWKNLTVWKSMRWSSMMMSSLNSLTVQLQMMMLKLQS